MRKLLIVTVCIADDDEPITRLKRSCEKLGLDFAYFGIKDKMTSFQDLKMTRLADFLKQHSNYEYTLYTDGFDSFMLKREFEIIERFKRLNSPLVVAGEFNCYPDISLIPKYPKDGVFNYICAGQFMGKTKDLIVYLEAMVAKYGSRHEAHNDQAIWSWAYVDQFVPIKVDLFANLFLSAGGVERESIDVSGGELYYKGTGGRPAAIHFNGPKGDSQNAKNMEEIYNLIYG